MNSKNDKFLFDNLSKIQLGLSYPEPSQYKNGKPFLTRATFNNFQMHLESLQDPHDFNTVRKMNMLIFMQLLYLHSGGDTFFKWSEFI